MDILILIILLFFLYKGKIVWVLWGIILLTTEYLGAGTSLSEFPFLHNVSDSGLILFFFLAVYLLNKNNWVLPKTYLTKNVIYFFIFITLSILVDFVFNGIDLISVIKTSRHWLFISCVWIFYYVSSDDVEKLITYLLTTLIIISLIMLFQFLTGFDILAREGITETSKFGMSFQRGAIPSPLIIYFTFLLFSNYFTFNTWSKYFYIIIFLAVIITSMIRSWFLVIVIGIIMIVNMNKKIKFKNILGSLIIVSGLIYIISSTSIIQQRFSEGFDDIQSYNASSNVQGNFSFRLLHIAERMNYVIQNPQYILFGVGNVIEQKFPNIFYIGQRDQSGRVIQLDTADISWSILFIRLGFLGTIIYVLYYLKIILKFYRFRFKNPLIRAATVYLFLYLIIISFVSWDIATGQFWLFPVLIYYTINRI